MAIGSSIALKEKIYELKPYKAVVDAPDAAVKTCPDCGGTGVKDGGECPLCHGRRYVCAVCLGTGVYSGNECPFCFGEGVNPSAVVDWEKVDTDDPEDAREHADPEAAWVAASVPASEQEGLRRTVRLPYPVAGKALESNSEGVFGVKYDPETMEINVHGELGSKVVKPALARFSATGHVFREGGEILTFEPTGEKDNIYVHGDDYGDGIAAGEIVIPGKYRWVKLDALFAFKSNRPLRSKWEYGFAFRASDAEPAYEFDVDTTETHTVVPCVVSVYNSSGNPVTISPKLVWKTAGDDLAGMTEADNPVLECTATLTVTAI